MMRAVRVTEVTTGQAAAAVGRSVPAFRVWAHRVRLDPVRRIRVGRSTHALWDLDEVLERHAISVLPADDSDVLY